MIKLGIIGTGWISDQFIEACAENRNVSADDRLFENASKS